MQALPERTTERLWNRPPWWRVSAALAASCLCGGCATPPERPMLAESPTPLVAGATLVAPIDRAGAAWTDGRVAEPSPILLGDGQRVPTSVVTLARQPHPAGRHTWLPDPGPWRSVTGDREDSITMLLADLPRSGLGQSVWMDGRRLPAFWLLPEWEGASPAEAAQSPEVSESLAHRARALVAPELGDPTLRWRAALALARRGVESPEPTFGGVQLAWAQQFGDRWRAAERRLREADPGLADTLLETLTRWLSVGDAIVPLWPTSGGAINDLVLAILRPGATDEAIRRSVRAFLDRQPEWLAWVADDAGGVVGGSIATVNLNDQPALLSVRPPGGAWEAHSMLEPGQLATVNIPTASSAARGPAVWELRLGGRSRSLALATDAIALQPPGMPIGPFWNDWTLEGLIAGTGQSPTPGQSGWVGGLIHEDPRLDVPPGTSSGWAVYIEVRRPPCELPRPGQAAPEADAVRLSFGPTAQPRAEVSVRCTGLTTFGTGSPGAESALLTTAADRWSFTLPIDRSWLEPDGTLLIGAQFLPHDGPRVSWPRPLLPGQQSVGRVRIDPSAWSPRWSPLTPTGETGPAGPGEG
jgi:hypothetical protein